MTTRAQLRKGWCPGALRPMESGDGLLLRIRPRLGTVPVAALTAIAEAAATYGSGEIDLTNRGNLQLRGLSTETYPAALALLDEAGLIDADPGIESVRNIVVDPLSGIDPACADIRPLAEQLEKVLTNNSTFRQLPGKFGFSFSATTEETVGGRSTDIMVSVADANSFAIHLDGADEIGAVLSENRVIEALARLITAFIELRAGDPAIGRMKDAVACRGGRSIFAAAGLEPSTRRATDDVSASSPPVGTLAHSERVFAAGIGLPFGRIDAQQLRTLYTLAIDLNLNSVRTSPQRVLVFPVEHDAQALTILREANRLGLITMPDDPRLEFDVCPGSPACANATTETRQDAQRIADALQGRTPIPSLHISGCEKGCARRAAAALTLVARNGRYDLICNGGPTGPVALAGVKPAEIDAAVARFIFERAS
jgi:precorrin-3B synthase